ncbi:MAG TPA: hypothetical protein VFT16_05200 [Candidatus Saccharimonadales bacterium]|nr:hypothetical protein [Candidatus Saccharimonadales bacterium]
MANHAAARSETSAIEALQAYADDTKGERKLSTQFRKWRTRTLIGGVALGLAGVMGVRSLFGGGGEAPDQSRAFETASGDASSSAPAAPASSERLALECRLDALENAKEDAQGNTTLNLRVVTTGANNVTYHVREYNQQGSVGNDLPVTGGNGLSGTVVSIPSAVEGKPIGVYADTGQEQDTCGSFYVDDSGVHFTTPEQGDPPIYTE